MKIDIISYYLLPRSTVMKFRNKEKKTNKFPLKIYVLYKVFRRSRLLYIHIHRSCSWLRYNSTRRP